ncbi:hypothetical protein N329_12044, partial [Haliaeetus albicilla]
PLPMEKVTALEQLMAEQVEAGHLVPSTSPWNTRVFTILKKSGKWRLLQDLHAVNKVMQDMGSLQPGIPSPTMLPRDWPLIVVDFKDCFFTIPLHPDDCEKFAFTIPTINRHGPAKRYHWVVLPQGMKNSPTICQWFVDIALEPFRKKWKEALIYHYMDDLLVCAQQLLYEQVLFDLKLYLGVYGLVIAPEKVQLTAPWKYLGLQVAEASVCPQKLSLHKDVQNIHDVQKLVGDLQWIRPYCGITNTDLQPLLDLL